VHLAERLNQAEKGFLETVEHLLLQHLELLDQGRKEGLG
jgi:hypothetical protein